MKIYKHRVNTKFALENTNPIYGVEIDLRTQSGSLILSHDPFVDGELFTDWLTAWNGQSLILNVKEDSLEDAILKILALNDITDFFFLDQSYPSIRRMIGLGLTKIASRVSDFEDIDTSLKSGTDWVWLDSFSGNWDYLADAVAAIVKNRQKSCLVSPELQRPDSHLELIELRNRIEENHLKLDAVCTKKPESWSI